ncbi:MAG TPA: hypothetical protein VMD30_00360 [Tepidisphaeraceae bacterium]|nr:hypothetical protein [Tepidisphaeraceae bacterium]
MHQAVGTFRAEKGVDGMRCIPVTLALTALAIVLGFSRSARCDTIEVTDGSADPATGVYTYGVELTTTAVVNSGDGFVIYDIPGYMSSSLSISLPTGSFVASTSLLGNAVTDTASSATNDPATFTPNTLDTDAELLGAFDVPPITVNVDNPALTNLSYVYSGATIDTGVDYLGTLTVDAAPSSGTSTTLVASKDSGGSGSNGEVDVSTVTVPGSPNVGNGNPAPLPASFWGGGTLLALLAGMAISRKRNITRCLA